MDLKLLCQIETLANPSGLCCLSHHLNTSAFARPGLRRGQIRFENFGLNITKFINVHDSQIASFHDLDNRWTSSRDCRHKRHSEKKFHLNRWNSVTGGTARARQSRYIQYCPISKCSVVSSDKHTVHIFSLRVRVVGDGPSTALYHLGSSNSLDGLLSPNTGANPSSSLSFLKFLQVQFQSSEWRADGAARTHSLSENRN